jgi:hypothetical protein
MSRGGPSADRGRERDRDADLLIDIVPGPEAPMSPRDESPLRRFVAARFAESQQQVELAGPDAVAVSPKVRFGAR